MPAPRSVDLQLVVQFTDMATGWQKTLIFLNAGQLSGRLNYLE